MAAHCNLDKQWQNLLQEVKIFINDGYSNLTYVKQVSERKSCVGIGTKIVTHIFMTAD